MSNHNSNQRGFRKLTCWPGVLSAIAVIGLSLGVQGPAQAGAFIFAGDSYGLDLILHPAGYTGTGGTLEVGVCISTESANQAELEIPVRNNVFVWNAMAPIPSNVQTGAVSGLDVESVLLHEMGHCIGLAHVNAASESGLSGDDTNYTKALKGANNLWDLDAGADGVVGSNDDLRGDDVSLHWFNPNNDPFELPVPTPMDPSTYTRDPSFLPPGHTFAENASREISALRGYPYSEAVMQQMTYYNETQRDLTGDGVATMGIGASGLDETAGTADDYTLELVYRGVQGTNASPAAGCDITISLEGTSFAYCSVGGSGITSGHWRITNGTIFLDPTYNWHFNTELRGNQMPDAVNDSDSVDEDSSVNIDVLANDTDPDGDTLSVSSVTDPPNGTASINPDDTIAYSPDPNFNGTDNFNYTAVDPTTGSDTATVTVTVNPVNDAPDAVNDSATTKGEDPVDIDVLLNDNEVDGETLSITSVTEGSKGSVTNHGTYVTYQANAGLTLPTTDTFDYTAWDGQPGSTDTATVTVTINPRQAPVASFTYSISDKEVTFTDTSTDDYGSVVGWSWDFGDTSSSTQQNPVHTFAAYTAYTVTLTVTDDDGETDDFTDTVTLVEPPPTSPSGLSATAISANLIDVVWTDNSDNESSFTLQRSDDGFSSSVDIPLGANVTAYRDSGLTGSTTYDYRVYATGLGGDSSPSNTDSATTEEACSANKSFTGLQWYQFALPCNPYPNGTVGEIFSGFNVQVWDFDPTTDMYSRVNSGDAMTPGTGYWVQFIDAGSHALNLSGFTNTLSSLTMSGHLTNGLYNLAGYLGHNSIGWDTVDVIAGAETLTLEEADEFGVGGNKGKLACDQDPPPTAPNWDCVMSRKMHMWNGANYSVYAPGIDGFDTGVLNAFDAIWVEVFDTDVSLSYPSGATSPASAETVASTEKTNNGKGKDKDKKPGGGKNKASKWFIRLVASSGEWEDRGNILGQHADSVDGLDSRDFEELMPFGGTYLSILFTNPLFPDVAWGYTSDYRKLTSKPADEWPFVVRTSDLSSEVTLSWETKADMLAKAWLVDEQSGERIKVEEGGSYTFLPAGETSSFTFIIE